MICFKCMHAVYGQAFTNTNCIVCGKEIITGHMPGREYCKECSDRLGLCEQCGNIIDRK